MAEIKSCDICGKVSCVQRSYSRRLTPHKCKEYSSWWGSKAAEILDWNTSNSQNTKEDSPSTSSNTQSKQALREIAADIEKWATPPVGKVIRMQPSVLRKWVRQLLAL